MYRTICYIGVVTLIICVIIYLIKDHKFRKERDAVLRACMPCATCKNCSRFDIGSNGKLDVFCECKQDCTFRPGCPSYEKIEEN